MQEWIQQIFGNNVNPIVAYIVIFLLIILAIYTLVRIGRMLLGGTYVAGGKSRHLRLAVMDATPVDSHRRLVLVRRDDVEHLILIGGSTDIVIEQNIRLTAQPQARPVPSSPTFSLPIPAQTPLEPPAPPTPSGPVQPTVQQTQPAPRQYTPAPIPPTQVRSAPPAPVRPLAPIQPRIETRPVESRPLAAPNASMPYERPIPPSVTKIEAPAVAAALATPAAPLVPTPTKPVSLEDSLLVDLSKDIERATNNDANSISLEDEMKNLLANLDTKGERIG